MLRASRPPPAIPLDGVPLAGVVQTLGKTESDDVDLFLPVRTRPLMQPGDCSHYQRLTRPRPRPTARRLVGQFAL
jgi:hypothetical protein